MKKVLWISLITFVGLILRLLFIDKPEGLWNDEYTSWFISSIPIGNDFFTAVKNQCHMPFYYLYLKFVMTFFGQSDILLRLTSVFAGVISIIAMYFVGKEKNETTAIVCAIITALSSFLIYYSQEVRFYSILFFFSALSLLSIIKLTKEFNKKNLIFYFISTFLILFTHTIGFVYVFFTLTYLTYKLRKKILPIWITLGILATPFIPAILNIFNTKFFTQWWGHFTISKIGFLFTDYFSPILTNLTNAPDEFFYKTSIGFLFFILTPTLIALIGLARELKNGIISIAIGTTLILLIAALSGKMVFLTKYSIEIYPILIYSMACGLLSFKKTWLKYLLITIFCLTQFTYLLISNHSAFKIKRAEGHNIVAQMLSRAELKKGDSILLEYYSQEKFEKYFDFSPFKVYAITKGNFNEYLTPNTSFNNVLENGKTLYKNTILNNQNQYFNKTLSNEVLKNMKSGEKLTIIVLNSSTQINKGSYDSTPLLYLVFDFVKKNSITLAMNELSVIRYEDLGKWAAITFYKT